MREFSRDNKVTHSKKVSNMTYREFYDYAYRKITEEIRLCSIRYSEYTKQLEELIHEKQKHNAKYSTSKIATNLNNIKFVMSSIEPDRNVEQDIFNTVYSAKYRAENTEKNRSLQNINNMIRNVDKEAENTKKDIEYWNNQLKKYNSGNVADPNKRINTGFWTRFSNAFISTFGIGIILGCINCYNSCSSNEMYYDQSCTAMKIGILAFFKWMIIYAIVLAIIIAIYCKISNSNMDWPKDD